MSLFSSMIQSPARNQQLVENTAPGQSVKPLYDIVDSKDGYALTVYLPGVSKDGLQITAEESELRIVGRPAWKQPEGWTILYNEAADVPFELVLEHGNSIDVEKIHAELRDGVLRASLPKAEALRPRKISVS